MPSEYPSTDQHRRAAAVRRNIQTVTNAQDFRREIERDPAFKRFVFREANSNKDASPVIDVEAATEPTVQGGVSMLSRGTPKQERGGVSIALEFIGDLAPAFVSLAQTGIENALDGRTPVEAFQYLRDQSESSPFEPIDRGMPVTDCLSSLMAQHATYIAMLGLLVAIDQNGAEW